MLASRCGEGAGGYVHWGATTQDIMDTATVLQLRRAHRILARDLTRVVDAAAHLAARYRDTPMAGRTHGQQALPITFGFKRSEERRVGKECRARWWRYQKKEKADR